MRINSRVLRIGTRILDNGRRALLEVVTSLRGYNKTFGSRFQGLLDSLDVHQSQLIGRENNIKQIPPWAGLFINWMWI
jgi:hypothetical protein